MTRPLPGLAITQAEQFARLEAQHQPAREIVSAEVYGIDTGRTYDDRFGGPLAGQAMRRWYAKFEYDHGAPLVVGPTLRD